jgi:magnesium transporter
MTAWSGWTSPTEVFNFHPLAIKDALERNRVPKLHAYADHVFVVLHAPKLGRRGHVHYIELDQFIGRRYLVTVHGPINPAVDPAVALRQTSAVLARIKAGRLMPATGFELSYAVVSALTRDQEDFIEAVTKDVWRLEQQVTGGELGNPEEFVNELFQARHGLLAVRTMAALSAAIYGRMATLQWVSSDGRRLIADTADQFERVRSVADGEKDYLQGVIDFYQTVLTLRVTPATQAQNEEVGQLTQASYTQNRRSRKSLPGRRSCLLRRWLAQSTDELRAHARAQLDPRLPGRAAPYVGDLGRALHRVETTRLAVNRSCRRQRRQPPLTSPPRASRGSYRRCRWLLGGCRTPCAG